MPTAKKSETDTIETTPKTGLELTEREKALAAGLDPDDVGEAPDEDLADDTEVDEPEEDTEDSEDSEVTEDTAESEDKDVPDWREGVKELAESYGMDDDALSAFDDEKDFRRFASIYEKTLSKEAKPKETKQEVVKDDEPPAKSAEAEGDDLDPAVFENEGYDENTLKIVKTVAQLQSTVKSLVARNEELSQLLEQSNGQREIDALTLQINEMGGRFGDGEKLTADQKKARERLLGAVDIVKQSFEAKGVKASTQTILQRAELLEFGDELIAEAKAKEKEALSQSVKKQSAKRRAVGRNTKPPARRELPGAADDPVKAIANLPEIVEAWEAAQF